jgi:hypothetical protein
MSTLLAILPLSVAPSVSGWHIIIIGGEHISPESTDRIAMLSSG